MDPTIATKALCRFVKSGTNREELSEFVKLLKLANIGKIEMETALESARAEADDEATEDAILEVLEFVIGFCIERNMIYPTEKQTENDFDQTGL